MIVGFSMPYRLARNWFGGGVMILWSIDVWEDVPSKQLAKGIFIEVTLGKTKWLIFGT